MRSLAYIPAIINISKRSLTKDQERKFIEFYQNNKNSKDQKTKKKAFRFREKLILDNLEIVKKISLYYNNNYLNQEDIFQTGILGLIKSIDKFNLEFNQNRLATYSFFHIKDSINQELIKNGSNIKIPSHYRKMMAKIEKMKDENGDLPSIDKISEKLGISPKKSKELIGYFQLIYKCEKESYEFDEFESTQTDTNLFSILEQSSLNSEEKTILRLKYSEEMSVKEISDSLKIGISELREIESYSINILRYEMKETNHQN